MTGRRRPEPTTADVRRAARERGELVLTCSAIGLSSAAILGGLAVARWTVGGTGVALVATWAATSAALTWAAIRAGRRWLAPWVIARYDDNNEGDGCPDE